MAPLGIQFCTWAAIVLVRTEWCALFVALLSAAAAVRGTVSTAIFLSSFLTVVVVSPAKDFATAATEDGIIGALDSSTVVPLAAAVGGNRGGGQRAQQVLLLSRSPKSFSTIRGPQSPLRRRF